ncbi:MAG: hypothetical protein AAGJ80_01940 [Cyanobacteria bacterium J06553_1]
MGFTLDGKKTQGCAIAIAPSIPPNNFDSLRVSTVPFVKFFGKVHCDLAAFAPQTLRALDLKAKGR